MIDLAWDGGGEAKLVALEDDRVTVRSSKAWAPGSRPTGRLPSGDAFRMKVHRCKRDEEGIFTIDGAALDMTRTQRDYVKASLVEPT